MAAVIVLVMVGWVAMMAIAVAAILHFRFGTRRARGLAVVRR